MKILSHWCVIFLGVCGAASFAHAGEAIDIPRVDGITIDGKGTDWGDNGRRVETLVGDAGEVRVPGDFDASFRLGWDDRGILVLVNVHERKIVEADEARDLSQKDCVEMALGTAPGSLQYVTVSIGTGADPRFPAVRRFFKDTRQPAPGGKLEAEAAATHTAAGYVLESRLPWSDLGIKPVPGKVVGFQLRVNDVDPSGSRLTVSWCPGYHATGGVAAMFPVRLANTSAQKPDEVAVRVVLDQGRPRIDAVAPADLAGQYLSASSRSAVFSAGDKVFSFGQFVSESGRARASVFLPVTACTVSTPDHGRTEIEPDDVKALVAKAINEGHVVFHGSVFSGESFPQCDFEAADASASLGKCLVTAKFYDAAFHEVKSATIPGRYGAVVQVETLTGQTFKRFATLYRTPHDINWRPARIHIGSLDLPPELGLDPAALVERSKDVDDFFKHQIVGGLNRTPDAAVLFAGLAEWKPGAGPPGDRNGPAAADQKWWYGLKKQTGDLRTDYYVHLPASYASDLNKKWPLILFLHGSGERGYDVHAVTNTGLPHNAEQQPDFPFIVIAPQCSPDESWCSSELDDLLDRVGKKYRVDTSRVYLTGLSMGGFGSWTLAAESPSRFAAVVPICGGGDPADASQLKDIPIWVFHGGKDPTVPIQRSQEMVDALKKVGGNVKFTIFPEAGHDSWTQAYAMPELYDWLLQQHRN